MKNLLKKLLKERPPWAMQNAKEFILISGEVFSSDNSKHRSLASFQFGVLADLRVNSSKATRISMRSPFYADCKLRPIKNSFIEKFIGKIKRKQKKAFKHFLAFYPPRRMLITRRCNICTLYLKKTRSNDLLQINLERYSSAKKFNEIE